MCQSGTTKASLFGAFSLMQIPKKHAQSHNKCGILYSFISGDKDAPPPEDDRDFRIYKPTEAPVSL